MVSIIIPVFNAARCLPKCVKSVLSQTYTEFECILINDGSQDNSLSLCQYYAMKDSRVFVIDKENEGVDKARFDGLNHAKGEFVMFVDSDDWLEVHALEELVKPMCEFEADMVVGLMRGVYNIGCFFIRDWRNRTSKCSNRLILHEEMMKDYYISFFGINLLPVSMCATLYRRSIINEAKLRPSGLGFGEDLTFNMKLMPYVRRYYMIDKVIYNYRKDSLGSSSKYLDNWLKNARLLFDTKMSQIENLHYNKAVKWQLIEYVNYIKTYVSNTLIHDSKNLESRKNLLRDEFLLYKFANKVYPLLTMDYKDTEFFNAIQKEDIDQLFEIIHSRLMQNNFLYNLRVRLGVSGIRKY